MFKITDYNDDYAWVDGFDSTNVSAIFYDHYKFTLAVKYHNGERYLFTGVPTSVYYKLVHSPSKGKFLNTYVYGHYSSTKIIDEKPSEETAQ